VNATKTRPALARAHIACGRETKRASVRKQGTRKAIFVTAQQRMMARVAGGERPLRGLTGNHVLMTGDPDAVIVLCAGALPSVYLSRKVQVVRC